MADGSMLIVGSRFYLAILPPPECIVPRLEATGSINTPHLGIPRLIAIPVGGRSEVHCAQGRAYSAMENEGDAVSEVWAGEAEGVAR